MANSPVFIHGDKIFINTHVQKANGLPFRLDDESYINEFGFVLPMNLRSFTVVDDLLGRVSGNNVASCEGLLLSKEGTIYEYAFIGEENQRIGSLLRLPNTKEIVYRAFNGKLEERIEICIQLGYKTPEEILGLLGKHTHLNTSHYKMFSKSEIVEKLNKLKTQINPEIYLLRKTPT